MQLFILLLVGMLAAGCQFEEIEPGRTTTTPVPEKKDRVPIPTTLTEGCFDFPGTPFGIDNWTNPVLNLPSGSVAVDFTLETTDGEAFTLSELLQTKPVMIQTGSLTSPGFQNSIDATNDLVETYGEQVHVVDLYTVEAYPETEPSPYRGTNFAQEFSTVENPTTYAGRVDNANLLDGLNDDRILLIDDLSTNRNNPFWCTFGTAPNSGFLIDQEGVIDTAQVFYDPAAMGNAIDALVNP